MLCSWARYVNHNCFSLLHRQKLIVFPWKIGLCSSVKRGNKERYLSCILHKKITKCPSHWVKTDLAIHRAELTNSAVTALQKRTVENSEVSTSFNNDHLSRINESYLHEHEPKPLATDEEKHLLIDHQQQNLKATSDDPLWLEGKNNKMRFKINFICIWLNHPNV